MRHEWNDYASGSVYVVERVGDHAICTQDGRAKDQGSARSREILRLAGRVESLERCLREIAVPTIVHAQGAEGEGHDPFYGAQLRAIDLILGEE